MSLARKLAVRIGLVLAGLVLVAGASLYGLTALSSHFRAAEDQYERLRGAYEVGYAVTWARSLLQLPAPQVEPAREKMQEAISLTDRLLAGETAAAGPDQPADPEPRKWLESIRGRLSEAMNTSETMEFNSAGVSALNDSLSSVAALANRIQGRIVDNRAAAARHFDRTLLALGLLAGLTVVVGVGLGLSQYRGVLGPLRRMEQAMRGVAEADFSERLPAEPDREFQRMAGQFNRMAEELEGLYRRLEQQVVEKSRQLITSERLAVVGQLAAGVAHEINNPLGIIGGYAESALRRIEEISPVTSGGQPGGAGGAAAGAPAIAVDAQMMERVKKSLQVICEQAFRGKEITGKLLSLCRAEAGPQGAPTEISAAQVVRDVGAMAGGLPDFRGRSLEVRLPPDDDLRLMARAGELSQVLINLVFNAMAAVNPEGGRVWIEGRRRGSWIELCVGDDGRGMTPEVLERVFEPFFSVRAADQPRGTGLGLSVSHAIVRQYGGRLTARSPGPGLGSLFTLEWPAGLDQEAPDV